MAKKNIRLEKSESSISSTTPERRRTVAATSRKPATSPDGLIAEPDRGPAVVRHTAAKMHTAGDGNGSTAPTVEQIAEAAYHRYLQRGGQHGYDFEDWIDAERALRARR